MQLSLPSLNIMCYIRNNVEKEGGRGITHAFCDLTYVLSFLSKLVLFRIVPHTIGESSQLVYCFKWDYYLVADNID
jgi:hypothetical protein